MGKELGKIIIHLLLCFVCLCYFQVCFGQSDSILTKTIVVKKTEIKVPVVPFGDTLFYIDANIGSFSAKKRAESITGKIKTLSKIREFHSDSIKIVSFDNDIEIVFQDIVIMGITAADLATNGETQLTLAYKYKKIIGNAITEYKEKNNWRYILLRVFYIILIIVVQYLLIRLVNKLFRRISGNIKNPKGKKIKSLKIKSFILMNEEKTTKLLLSCAKIVKYLIIVLMLYSSITLIFSVFPFTRSIADKLFGYVLTPIQKIFTGIVKYFPNLITIIVIVLVFRYLINGLRYLAEEIDKERLKISGFYSDWARPTFSIIKTLLYAFMFIVIFPYLPGSDSKVFQGVSVFIGVVFSLGSSSIISNVVSGFVLTYMRPFKIGDRIKIGEVIGNVIEKTPFVTRLRTPKNEEITMSNSSIMSAQTFNYSHSAEQYGLILHTEISLGYDIPWRKIHQLLLEAAARTAFIETEPKPFVLQTALNDFYAVYQINIYIRDANKMANIYSELNQHIQDIFCDAGIELVTPNYTVERNEETQNSIVKNEKD